MVKRQKSIRKNMINPVQRNKVFILPGTLPHLHTPVNSLLF
jgi:hypothetical protein